jgi:hypothetical protein
MAELTAGRQETLGTTPYIHETLDLCNRGVVRAKKTNSRLRSLQSMKENMYGEKSASAAHMP